MPDDYQPPVTDEEENEIKSDPELGDERDPAGHMPDHPEDIDEFRKKMRLPNDDNGPHELDPDEVQ